MNRYGAQLMRQWQQNDPKRYQAIEDKQDFFEALGSEAQREIETLAAAIAGPDRPGETYLEKVARLNTARVNAESDVLRGMLAPDPHDPEIDERKASDWASEAARETHRSLFEDEEE